MAAIIKNYQIIFDWRQLKRWSIDETKLPAGSTILYREESIWTDHKQVIIAIIASLLSLIFIILALIIQDSRRRRTEQELQKLRDERAHISRVLSMGEISASLAHELNQPLSAIRTYAQAAQRFLNNIPAAPDETGKALAGIIIANRRAEEVLKRIRMALKKEPFEQKPVHIKDIIQDVLILVGNKAKQQNVSIKQKIPIDLPTVSGDSIQLQQVLINLILNAIESMQGITYRPHEILISALQEESSIVKVSVWDNGIGINIQEQHNDILFDAFYTTKAEGMGMGLSISRSIIEDHGGQLRASLNTYTGSTFSFTIPVDKNALHYHPGEPTIYNIWGSTQILIKFGN